MENNVRFIRFTPNKNDKQICSDIFSMINDFAPSNSFIEAQVNQDSNGAYTASISVGAVCGNFHVESTDSSLLNSFKKAQKDLMKNLNEWKSHRFLLT